MEELKITDYNDNSLLYQKINILNNANRVQYIRFICCKYFYKDEFYYNRQRINSN